MENSQNQSQQIDARVHDDKKLAYDKAIEGYQFQVERYNTWMNYYALFVGALFVALYTVWPTNGGDDCKCCDCHTFASVDADNWILLLIIAALGLLASLCWYGALLGYRKWNEHWMEVIHRIEGKVFEAQNPSLMIYRDMPQTDNKYAAGYVSTQKITGIFIIGIMTSWLATIGFIIYKLCDDWCHTGWWIAGLALVIAALIACLHGWGCRVYSSVINRPQ